MENKKNWLHPYSFSQIILSRKCLFSYFLSYKIAIKERKKQLPNRLMILGGNIHDQIATDISGDILTEYSEKFQRFVKENFPEPVVEKVDCKLSEKLFSIDYGLFRLCGAIDMYSVVNAAQINICDWKTGYSEGDPEQLKLYCVYLLKKHPETQTFKCFFYYTSKDYYSTHILNRSEIAEHELQLQDELFSLHNRQEWPAQPGAFCNICPHVGQCKLAEKYAITNITTIERAQELANRVIVAEGFIAQAKTILKEFQLQENIPLLIAGDKKLYLSHSITYKLGAARKKDIEIFQEISTEFDKKIIDIVPEPIMQAEKAEGDAEKVLDDEFELSGDREKIIDELTRMNFIEPEKYFELYQILKKSGRVSSLSEVWNRVIELNRKGWTWTDLTPQQRMRLIRKSGREYADNKIVEMKKNAQLLTVQETDPLIDTTPVATTEIENMILSDVAKVLLKNKLIETSTDAKNWIWKIYKRYWQLMRVAERIRVLQDIENIAKKNAEIPF